MRIAYLTLQATRDGQAAYVHVHEMVNALKANGCAVEIFAPSYSQTWDKPIFILRIIEHIRTQARLALRLRNFHIIYVRAHFMALPISLLATLFKVPVVHEVNGPYADVLISYPLAGPLREILRLMQWVQYRLAKGLIAVTPQLKEWLMAQCDKVPVIVVSNGANIKYFNPNRNPDPTVPSPYVVFVGSLSPWHGMRSLIEAVHHRDWPAEVRLVIVGEGPESALVQRAAETTSRMVVLGWRPYTAIGSIIVGAVAGLVPISDPGNRSRTGLAPLKLFEVLACGVPAIVSDLPGQSELVRKYECGIVYPLDDARALAQSVAELFGKPDVAKMMGKRGFQLVETEYSWDILAKKTEGFLAEVVAKAA